MTAALILLLTLSLLDGEETDVLHRSRLVPIYHHFVR